MASFSSLDIKMNQMASNVSEKFNILGNLDFEESERTAHKVKQRLDKSQNDFWYFDKTYFTPSMYHGGYVPPCSFQKELVEIALQKDVRIVLGPRKHAKTVTAKKMMVWLHLTGRVKLSGIYCETLPKASNMVNDICQFISKNSRIMHDYKVKILENNDDQCKFVRANCDYGVMTIAAFSEGRSVRGYTEGMSRPSFILGDDIETLESSMSDDAVEKRVRKIAEAFQSLEGGTFLILGNNINEKCALNRLKLEQDNGLLPEQYRVYVYRAWDDGKPMWKKKYPAKTEEEFKAMVGALDESDYQSNFQQNPIPPDGFTFSRAMLRTVPALPEDARGVLFVDPNLSKKGKGDTTAVTSMKYSPKEDLYIIDKIACRSFKDSNELLERVIKLKDNRHNALGFDGNVSQESTWTQHVRNYCRVNNTAYPYISYCRYNVDNLAKNASGAWNEGKIVFLESALGTKEADKYLQQVFSFAGKRANKADDAPDTIISAFELMSERRLGKRSGNSKPTISIIQEAYL